MTDDELQSRWIAGESLNSIAKRAGVSKHVIGGKVRLLRRAEGIERWPYHEDSFRPRRQDPPKRPKAGASTLPPLASLEGHGETPHR
jgi:hypothetical protein